MKEDRATCENEMDNLMTCATKTEMIKEEKRRLPVPVLLTGGANLETEGQSAPILNNGIESRCTNNV